MDKNKIVLTQRDMEIFINSTLNPKEPNEALKNAMKNYKIKLKCNRGHGKT